MSRSDGTLGRGPDADPDRDRPTATDLLPRLDGDGCPVPDCGGTLARRPFKDSDAVVCDDCGTPALRVWGDDDA